MKKIIIASAFSLLCTLSFAADKCTAECHKLEHKCTAACTKTTHVYKHGEKGHMCTMSTCKHDCSKECMKK